MFGILKKKKKERTASAPAHCGRGIMVFDHTSDVIAAEKMLQKGDWAIRVMGPPPEIQSGCDLVIEFPLIEELELIRALAAVGISPLQVIPVTSALLKPVDLFQTIELDGFLMVRAANMKITVDRQTRKIVNISGGGCPDVPYLAWQMVGRPLDKAPRPRDLGHTLCGYALELAYQEMRRKCSE